MGTNNLSQIGTSPVLAVGSQVDQYFEAVSGDFVPRNASGVVTASAGSIGSATYPFSSGHISGDLTVDTDTLYVDSTNDRVGIGTASPSSGLTLKNSNDSTTNSLEAFNDNDERILLLSQDAGGDAELNLYANGSDNLKIKMNTDGDSYFNGGNVGIGTDSPASELHIDSESGVSEARIYSHGASSFLTIGRSQGTKSSQSTIGNGQELGRINFDGYTGTAYRTGAAIYVDVSAGVSGDEIPSSLVFATTADGATTPTDRVIIDEDGNVGIGTTNPSDTLDVAGIITSSDVNPRLRLLGTTTDLFLQNVDSNGRFRIYNDTTNSEDFTIDSGGKVGIGTAMPTLPIASRGLHIDNSAGSEIVVGGRNINFAGAFLGGLAILNNDSTTASNPHYVGIQARAVDTSGNAILNFYTGTGNYEANNPQMTIDESGNVDIDGSITGTSAIITGSIEGQSAIITGSIEGQSATIEGTTTGQTAGTNYDNFVIDDDTNSGLTILSSNSARGSIAFGDDDDNDVGIISYNHNDNQFEFTTNGNSSIVKISSAGDIEIGNPASPSANSGKVIVFGDNGADPTMGSNTAGIYAKDVSGTVEMFAVDEADNSTQLSAHNPENGEWRFYSKNTKTGRIVEVDLEQFFKHYDSVNGTSFFSESIPLQ